MTAARLPRLGRARDEGTGAGASAVGSCAGAVSVGGRAVCEAMATAEVDVTGVVGSARRLENASDEARAIPPSRRRATPPIRSLERRAASRPEWQGWRLPVTAACWRVDHQLASSGELLFGARSDPYAATSLGDAGGTAIEVGDEFERGRVTSGRTHRERAGHDGVEHRGHFGPVPTGSDVPRRTALMMDAGSSPANRRFAVVSLPEDHTGRVHVRRVDSPPASARAPCTRACP